MEDAPIEINLSRDDVTAFNDKIYDLFYSTRPKYEECELRYKVLALMNDIWQQYLIEKEENAMINKSNQRYSQIITDQTHIEIETIESYKNRPYQKWVLCNDTKSDSNDNDKNNDLNNNDEQETNIWCTPIEAIKKVIIIREFEGGPIIKQIQIPPVLIFGSIAFGLDSVGSDVDIALPAGIYNQSVNAHLDGPRQVKLLKEFQNRLNLNTSKSCKLGFEWKIEPILHARVPIIKLTEMKVSGGKLNVDIGIRSTQMPITKLINYYCDYDERAALLYVFIKQWTKCRQISEAMYGFPNSFGYIMLVTKYLQILQEPIIPIMDYDRKCRKLIEKHNIHRFKPNTSTLLELTISFFDYWFNFDFETYQISITEAGLQWKHAMDYNLMHSDQSTMLIEDPSSKNENVTRCLKPHNLKIMQQEFFRAYKCVKNANWDLLFKPFNDDHEKSIFEIYPPIDDNEQEIRYQIEAFDEEEWYDDGENNGYHDPYYNQTNNTTKNRQNHNNYIHHIGAIKQYKKKKNLSKKNNTKYQKKKQNFYNNINKYHQQTV